MNEIKCPHCGGMFTIDEAGFAAILKQVRDAEFDKEVRRHEELLATEKQQAVQLAVAEALGKAQGDAAVKEARIAELEARLDAAARERENEDVYKRQASTCGTRRGPPAWPAARTCSACTPPASATAPTASWRAPTAPRSTTR